MPNTKLRASLLHEFGGKCSRCRYDRCARALQFHHKDSSEKRLYSRGRGNASLAEVQQHPERFELLCANCHFEQHEAQDQAAVRRVECEQCRASFVSQPHRERAGRGRFCSRRCLHDFRVAQARERRSVVPRFWKYAKVSEGCWEWVGSWVGRYPSIPVRQTNGRSTGLMAARVSYEIHHGPIPNNAQLIRSCQNPGCVNPRHLVVRLASA